MTRSLSAAAFLLGAIIVVWMGLAFVGSNLLALIVTVVIAVVYCVGFIELLRFQQATSMLSDALSGITEKVTALESWLNNLHPSLQNAARLRIEGEHVGLPAPILTPYLVGLLVMLGLLGTFVGMVDTLKGAVMALEGTSELEAIRAGLAAPIKGLGMAFGTSVAGVAASAMLGFISTLSRRDRMLTSRMLDSKVGTVFQDFSLSYNRQQTFKAMQIQADALPKVAEQLTQLAGQLGRMSEDISDKLISNQHQFHESVKSIHTDLANSVDKSLKESLAESGRLAGESIQPIVKELMTEISLGAQQTHQKLTDTTQKTHQKLTDTAQQQLQTLTKQFGETSEQVSQAWQTGLAAHQQSNEALTGNMNASLNAFNRQFENTTVSLLDAFKQTSNDWADRQRSSDQARLDYWNGAFEQLSASLQKTSNNIVADTQSASSKMVNEISTLMKSSEELVKARMATEASWLDSYGERMDQLTDTLATQLNSLRDAEDKRGKTAAIRMSELHSAASERLDRLTNTLKTELGELRTAEEHRAVTAAERLAELQDVAAEQLAQLTSTLKNELDALRVAEELRGETATERSLELHGIATERIDQLISTLRVELGTLRTAEEDRGEAAVARLGELQAAVTVHLATLGNALEEPMTRLIQTASETPRAAAEVIEKLRSEISKNIERDNGLLEERCRIMEELNSLSGSMEQASQGQREAIEKMVNASSNMLQEVGASFSSQVSSEVIKLSDIVDHFAGSATELSSLGDAFGLAVQMFNDTNTQLVDSLSHIEESLQNSSERSDEQLGYYVAQAREIIDHSMLSQQEFIEQLRQLGRTGDLFAAEAG